MLAHATRGRRAPGLPQEWEPGGQGEARAHDLSLAVSGPMASWPCQCYCPGSEAVDPAHPVERRAIGSKSGGCLTLRDLGAQHRFRGRSRFVLAPQGRVAEVAYRAGIVAARVQPGRRAFDAARSAWATPLDLQPDDGVYLGQLRAGSASLRELVAALVDCGMRRADALAALGRLVDAGLVEAVVDDPADSGST